ncbi:MAG: metal-dependent hydrolase [Candidatus Heimdallarchaeota archaeon]
MDFFTHLVVSVAIASTGQRDEDNQRAFIIGGIAPDFDVLASWLPILWPNVYFLQHRGLFHTIFFAPVVAAALIGLSGYLGRVSEKKLIQTVSQRIATPLTSRSIMAGLFGSMEHLLMDWISVRGVVLFYPLDSTRYSLSVISVVDPVITLLSTAIVILWLYGQVKESFTFSFPRFVKFSQRTSVLFVCLVLCYGALQVYTLTTQSPTSSTPALLPIYRWILHDESEHVTIQIVNQLSQDVEKTYSYPILTFNRTLWTEEMIETVIEAAKDTLDYKALEFQVDPESRLVFAIEFTEDEGNWEVVITNVLQDAQRRYYGLFGGSFFENEITISVQLDS